MIITGRTTSRLEEVKTYNKNKPYIIGVNGVFQVTVDNIIYIINGIEYNTKLPSLETTFKYKPALEIKNKTTLQIYYDDSYSHDSKLQTKSNININRQNFSVFEKIYRLNNIDEIGDFDTLPIGFF